MTRAATDYGARSTMTPRSWRTFVGVLLALVAVAAQGQSSTLDVPFVPTPTEVVNAMLKLAGVNKGDVVYDLGSGDGRIVIAAAKRHGAHAVGIDIDPARIDEATRNARQAGVADRVRFIRQDLFDADIGEATVVTLYLLPRVNQRLRPKLLAELKPGTRVVSHGFDMGDWKPERTIEIQSVPVYLWIVPKRPE
jgi:SAM-dependent methyltransferase